MAEEESRRAWPASWWTTPPISKVNPDTNSLLYRGYPVQELAAKCSFEEVAYLLWNGELPDAGAAGRVHRAERAGRALDPVVKQVIDALPIDGAPDGRLPHGGLACMGARHELAEDSSREANMAKAVDLFAAMPAVVAYDQRRRRGQDAGGAARRPGLLAPTSSGWPSARRPSPRSWKPSTSR